MDELKLKTMKYLSKKGIDIPSNLPDTPPLAEANVKSPQDIAARLCAITYLIGLGHGGDAQEILEQLEKYNLLNYVHEYEMVILKQSFIDENDLINMSWLSESAQALAWAIGLTELDFKSFCDEDLPEKIPFKEDPSAFIEKAQLRSIEEIQEQCDIHFRLLWYVINCRKTGQETDLSEGLIAARREAIEWVYNS